MDNAHIIGIDHIGYAVKNMEKAQRTFGALGFEFGAAQADNARNVLVSIGTRVRGGGIKLELLAPLNGLKSPIDKYLAKVGSTPYHICYRVDEMDASVAIMQQQGFTMLASPAPSIPLKGDVAFLYSPDIGIVELIK